jgi:hypothetical protein
MARIKKTQRTAVQIAVDLLTDEQAAAILSVEPRTLRLWRNTRNLPFLKLTPRVIRYRLSDLQAWLDRSRTVIG